MCSFSNGKNTIRELKAIWGEMIAAGTPAAEIEYRIKKLIFRLDVVADKIFIKTVKAQDVLRECVRLTEQFQSKAAIHAEAQAALMLLTQLEGRVEALVKETHEFRVKAG
jgi:hypothetical protein